MLWGSDDEKKKLWGTLCRDEKRKTRVYGSESNVTQTFDMQIMEWGVFSSLKGEIFNIHRKDIRVGCVGERVDAWDSCRKSFFTVGGLLGRTMMMLVATHLSTEIFFGLSFGKSTKMSLNSLKIRLRNILKINK